MSPTDVWGVNILPRIWAPAVSTVKLCVFILPPPGLVSFTRYMLLFLLWDFLFYFSCSYPTDHLWRIALQPTGIIGTQKASLFVLWGATEEMHSMYFYKVLYSQSILGKLKQEPGTNVRARRKASKALNNFMLFYLLGFHLKDFQRLTGMHIICKNKNWLGNLTKNRWNTLLQG